jgi:GTP pyrophosphokinase
MSDLTGAENSHIALPPVMGADYSEVGDSIKDFEEIFLSTPESVKLFQIWFSKQNDPDEANAFLNKLKYFSLSTSTIMALFLFMLYQKEEDIPTEIIKMNPDSSGTILSESIQFYHRLLKVHRIPFSPKIKLQAELAIRMLLTMMADVQLLTVFLVLQLQKLETMMSLSKDEQETTSWTALHIHSPLAGRLGIFWIKSELEDRAFRYLEYENYQKLKKKIARKRSERSDSVERISNNIQKILNQAGISHEVQGRYKRFYSIFQKLDRVDNDFERIKDLIAFRVLVKNVDECYAALSFIHESWNPVKNRFKDYISNPKPNGYQSLHTTVMEINDEPSNKPRPIEIQIRTHEMHHMAEYGVASHWLYKEKRNKHDEKKADQFVESFLEKINSDGEGKLNPVANLYSDKIYVITPAREIIELPQSASPLDFAYAIHTEVGNRTIAAKANGIITSLDSSLYSGDEVEILTSSRQEPRKEWLEFVKTRHARNKIKHALQEKNREIRKKEGMEMLEREFRAHGLNLKRLIRDGRIEQESRLKKNQEFEHILFCIGEGSIHSEEIRRWFTDDISAEQTSFIQVTESEDGTTKEKSAAVTSRSLIIVDGMDNVLTRIAKCCSPVKKQPILGYLTKERVISIHKQDCSFMKQLASERKLKVIWGKKN